MLIECLVVGGYFQRPSCLPPPFHAIWAISTVTPAYFTAFLIYCFHVFLVRSRRVSRGSVEFITLRATLFSSRLCTCPYYTIAGVNYASFCQLTGGSVAVLFPHSGCVPALITPRIPQSILISVVAIFSVLIVFVAQLALPLVKAGLMMTSYTVVSFCQYDHATNTYW